MVRARILSPAVADHLLHDLDEAQRRAVTSPARPLAILAPAGSGKTRVLTRRIAWRVATGDADASHVLALTFTRRAAGELGDRLRGLGLRGGVATGTFHGVAYAQLRARWADEGRLAPAVLARKAKLLAPLVSGGSLTVAQLASEIEWAKARLVGADAYPDAAPAARRRTPVSAARVAELYAAYEDAKRRARMVDFDDLLALCSRFIETDDAFAAAQRWRFQHLFVDEFQDVNPLQLQLLDAWRGPSVDLCVVGDPHQAIYGWNGADAGFLQGFRRLYPTAEVIALEGNYRSTPQILDAAADVLRRAEVGDRPLRATRVVGPPVRLSRHAGEEDEAAAVARAVRDRRGPRAPWSAQAVLVRTHAQVPLVTDALRRAAVPYRVRGADALLEDRRAREALDLLRRAGGPLAAALPDLVMLAGGADPDGDGDDAESAGGDRPVDVVVQLAHDHLRLDPGASAAGFVSWLVATVQAEGVDERRDAVTVATFHAAKGLEWPVVHLAGLEEGLVPIAHARSIAQRREEARLLYVAMTRAEDELCCTWAAERRVGTRPAERRLTPWLAGLDQQQREQAHEAAAPPPDWRRHLADQRAALADATAAPSPALAALHSWRETHARAARVEPASLVDDRLLAAIAERQPATPDELAAVPGMGPLLAARVGEGLLAALRPTAADESALRSTAADESALRPTAAADPA
jgi:DNA helicase-2/ATP-dependent DNA helicase PcrA